ncbi:MAG TPA: Pr6Pr family membrane protein [Sphingomicrobium sp.]|jgi:hypothetical protein|nr:Pr6Pr family membrane protein [Sphingomicrobium sp.]
MARAAAALVAIVCWIGLALNFVAIHGAGHDSLTTLWILARYFTILTNLLLAMVMTFVAIGGRASPFILGGLLVAILLVGVVYAILLKGLHDLRGPAAISDFLLHDVTPVAMALWWLLFAPRAKLRWSDALWWAAYPLAYLGYALLRGSMDGKYPYHFIDPARLGWLQTALNAAGIASGFIVGGLALVWIDRWRPLGSR